VNVSFLTRLVVMLRVIFRYIEEIMCQDGFNQSVSQSLTHSVNQSINYSETGDTSGKG